MHVFAVRIWILVASLLLTSPLLAQTPSGPHVLGSNLNTGVAPNGNGGYSNIVGTKHNLPIYLAVRFSTSMNPRTFTNRSVQLTRRLGGGKYEFQSIAYYYNDFSHTLVVLIEGPDSKLAPPDADCVEIANQAHACLGDSESLASCLSSVPAPPERCLPEQPVLPQGDPSRPTRALLPRMLKEGTYILALYQGITDTQGNHLTETPYYVGFDYYEHPNGRAASATVPQSISGYCPITVIAPGPNEDGSFGGTAIASYDNWGFTPCTGVPNTPLYPQPFEMQQHNFPGAIVVDQMTPMDPTSIYQSTPSQLMIDAIKSFGVSQDDVLKLAKTKEGRYPNVWLYRQEDRHFLALSPRFDRNIPSFEVAITEALIPRTGPKSGLAKYHFQFGIASIATLSGARYEAPFTISYTIDNQTRPMRPAPVFTIARALPVDLNLDPTQHPADPPHATHFTPLSSVTFTAPADPSTVNSSTIQLQRGLRNSSGSYDWVRVFPPVSVNYNPSTNTATLIAEAGLPLGHYRIYIDGVADPKGNTIPIDSTGAPLVHGKQRLMEYDFVDLPGNHTPMPANLNFSSAPQPNQCVQNNPDTLAPAFLVHLGEPAHMWRDSISPSQIHLLDPSGKPASVHVDYQFSSGRLVIVPTGRLSNGTYTIEVSGVVSIVGDPQQRPYRSQFQLQDSCPNS